ncbi:MAG: hypothetical protein IPL03_07245 [Sterolibacteriaceae bacterium]|nr:hypothetical protein [Candidatus Methylophosphatis haderslevensis]
MARRLSWIPIAMLLMIALAAALFARHWMIEPADIGHLCDSGQGPWWCGLRLAIIMSFARGWLGWFVLGAGVAATVLRWRWLAATAAVAGVAGLVLYQFVLSATGLLLGLLVLVRPAQRSAFPR